MMCSIMKKATLRDRLLPVRPKRDAYPDFSALSRRIFGKKKTRKTGTDLVSEERGLY
jgi:hypothetical protein